MFLISFTTAEAGPIGHIEELKKAIKARFIEHYPTLSIERIHLEPTSKKERFDFDEATCRIRLSKGVLQRANGTLAVKCGRCAHFLKYRIEGKIGLYKARHQIKKDKIVASDALERVEIPFTTLRRRPLTQIGEKRYIARRNIQAGKIVTTEMVAPIPEVRKHDRVRCVYRDEGLFVEFDATALQNGYIGDSVTVKRGDGRTLRGVVTGKKSVEIR
ncbi:flagellar basal body P-ring formation chaperone FlgA [Hydrogenimonas sp.]